MRCLRLTLSVAIASLAVAGCSVDERTNPLGSSSSSEATGAGGGGGAGGHGGAGQGTCVASPQPAAFEGTDECPAPVPAQKDAVDDALAAGGIDRCKVRLLPEDIELSGWPAKMLVDAHRLPDFTPLQRGPLRLPAYGRETAKWLDAAAASKNPVSDTLVALSVRRGHVIDEACEDLEVADEGDAPLATAVLALDEHLGAPGDEAALRAAAAAVPLELQVRLARVVRALDLAAAEVKAALASDSPTDLKYLARASGLYAPSMSFGFSTTATSLAKIEAVDVDRIATAAALLARAVEEADLGSAADAKFAPFEAQTPIGAIVVHDSSDDTYAEGSAAEDAALLFDLGGNDTYEVPAGASDDLTPVSLAIDVRGSDKYGYAIHPHPDDADLLPSDKKGRYNPSGPPTADYGPITLSNTPRQGSGDAGIGMLLDLGSERDTYHSLAVSQGAAGVGVGVLYDAGGDDEYLAEAASQGFAVFGIAALIDAGGNDVRRSFSLSQGFGGAKGVAAVVDLAGDDEYTCDNGNPAEGGHPLYFTPQLPGVGNSSMSQGAAQGRRPQDGNDASYMAGGMGILRDAAGKDHYTGSVFAQGVGYWQGIGMLLDGGDDPDTYDAYWYIQGSTAHFSLSLFLEEGGDDAYNQKLTPAATSIGVGHDFSASIHLDEGGNDHYRAPGLSLGSGNINGIGCLVNSGGDDVYLAAGDPTLGAGNYSAEATFGEPRQDAPTIGIFVDAGGTDSYTVGMEVRPLDGTTWSYEPQPYPAPQMVLTENGCGADSNSGSATLP